MDFNDTPQEAEFRAAARAFLNKHMKPLKPGEARDMLGERDDPDTIKNAQAWQATKKDNGWACLTWPKEYGGRDATPIQSVIWNQEEAKYDVPPNIFGIGIGMLGPTIMAHGTPEQKSAHLEKMARGDEIWCQLFSEPAAGSDLAGLRTTAVKQGDHWILNGQKIWTTGAHFSKWGMIVTRTDPTVPKHAGLTYFIVDMKSPGLTVRPLINAAMSHEFNEVFFEDVRIPRANIIGEENRGWYLAQTTLSFERSNIGGAVGARQTVEDLVKFAREHQSDNQSTLGHNRALRHELIERFVEAGVATMMSFKIVSIQANEGVAPGHQASVAKLYGTELNQRIYRTGMKVLGLYGQLDSKTEGPKPPMNGRMKYMYMRSIANTIEGGTSEIQRNIIATRGLGLPRA